jgi:hypothetical protein
MTGHVKVTGEMSDNSGTPYYIYNFLQQGKKVLKNCNQAAQPVVLNSTTSTTFKK